jgi:hypothetical protein
VGYLVLAVGSTVYLPVYNFRYCRVRARSAREGRACGSEHDARARADSSLHLLGGDVGLDLVRARPPATHPPLQPARPQAPRSARGPANDGCAALPSPCCTTT